MDDGRWSTAAACQHNSAWVAKCWAHAGRCEVATGAMGMVWRWRWLAFRLFSILGQVGTTFGCLDYLWLFMIIWTVDGPVSEASQAWDDQCFSILKVNRWGMAPSGMSEFEVPAVTMGDHVGHRDETECVAIYMYLPSISKHFSPGFLPHTVHQRFVFQKIGMVFFFAVNSYSKP